MADLEEHAFRRDRGFVVRLVLVIAVASVAGVLVWTQLTNDRTAGCAARTFGEPAEPTEGQAEPAATP